MLAHHVFSLVLVPHIVVSIRTNVITPSCEPTKTVCNLPPLVLELRQTMMLYTDERAAAYPIIKKNGEFRKRTNCEEGNDTTVTDEELQEVNTADGTYKYVTTINGEYPGPTLVLYKGQEVRVNVTNRLAQEGTGIHWHGPHQVGTNWMDGVPGVTMCAINPGETFEYRFIASPEGTHWYHSHYGLQRIDGLFGAFIVLPKPGEEDQIKATNEPTYDKDFLMMLNDFYPESANQMYALLYHQVHHYLYNVTQGCMADSGLTEDGTEAGVYQFYSALVNGKGCRFNDKNIPVVEVPFETYSVEQNKFYNFRVINAGMAFAFKVSVDQHPLTITATENAPITPQIADSLIVNEGERYEFYIYTNQTVNNYWIRIETLEASTPHHTLAILKYKGAPKDDPTSTARNCSQQNPCTVVNCPFRYLSNSVCVNVGDLKSPSEVELPPLDDEHILHFDFTKSANGAFRATVNGIEFELPPNPPSVLGRSQYDADCNQMDCEDRPCQCTNQLEVARGQNVQLTLFSKATSHPIHLHGHKFQVLKVGYPEYDSSNRRINFTDDIICNNEYCNKAQWSNDSWYGGNIAGLNLVNPIDKDTVTIPSGGYVVLRFTANNPGWWLLHCHIDVNFAEGMGLIIQSGTESDMVKPPMNFPVCGSFFWPEEAEESHGSNIVAIAIGSTIGGICILCGLIAVVYFSRKKCSYSKAPYDNMNSPASLIDLTA